MLHLQWSLQITQTPNALLLLLWMPKAQGNLCACYTSGHVPAGLSVAMGNASEQVKGVCHETTLSNNEDGVAAALRKFVLEPRGL